jgi:hypothetical protein
MADMVFRTTPRRLCYSVGVAVFCLLIFLPPFWLFVGNKSYEVASDLLAPTEASALEVEDPGRICTEVLDRWGYDSINFCGMPQEETIEIVGQINNETVPLITIKSGEYKVGVPEEFTIWYKRLLQWQEEQHPAWLGTSALSKSV